MQMKMKITTMFLIFTLSFSFAKPDENKLSIKDVMKLASKENYNLKQARLDVTAVLYQRQLVEKNKMPKIGLDVSASILNEMKTDNPPMSFTIPGVPPPTNVINVPPVNQVTPDHLYKGELSVIQPLYLGGAIKNGVDATLRLQKNKQDILIQVKQEILFQAIALYFNIVRAQKTLSVEERILALTQKNLSDMQIKYDAKTITKYELIRAESEVLESEVSFNQAVNELQNAKFELANVLHVAPDFTLTDSFSFTELEEPNVELEINNALKNRSDIKSFDNLIASFDAQIRAVTSEYKPQVFIRAVGGMQMPEMGLFGGEDKFGPTYQIGIGAQWVLFDGFKQDSRKMSIENDKFKYRLQKSILVEKVKEDVRKSCVNLTVSKKLYAISLKAQEKAIEVYNLVTVGYQNQQNTQLELIDARLQMSKTYRDLVNATFKHELARIQLIYLTGRLTEDMNPLIK